MRSRPSGRTTPSARVMVFVLLSVFTTFIWFFTSEDCDFEVAPGPQTRKRADLGFPGRAAVSAHQGHCQGFVVVLARPVRPPAVMQADCAPDGRQPPAALGPRHYHRVVVSRCGHLLGGGISATPLGVTDVRGDLILAGASPINRPTRPNGPMSRSRCLQTADRSIRTRCGATRSGAAGTAVWICDRRQLRDWSHDKPDDIHHPRGGQSAIIADQLPTRQTSGRRGERRPDVPGATDPERSATDCRHRRVQ